MRNLRSLFPHLIATCFGCTSEPSLSLSVLDLTLDIETIDMRTKSACTALSTELTSFHLMSPLAVSVFPDATFLTTGNHQENQRHGSMINLPFRNVQKGSKRPKTNPTFVAPYKLCAHGDSNIGSIISNFIDGANPGSSFGVVYRYFDFSLEFIIRGRTRPCWMDRSSSRMIGAYVVANPTCLLGWHTGLC